MDNVSDTKQQIKQSPRWFGAVRKKDGNLIIASRLTVHAPTQSDFVIGTLNLERGDQLLDLFLSSTLEAIGYHDYCNDAFRTQDEKQKERGHKRKRAK